MTDTWTDAELDAGLHELAGVLDRAAGEPGTASLAAVRQRLTGARPTTAADPAAEVLEFGAARADAGPARRRRLAPTLLLAAAVVIAVTLVAALRPGGADRSSPPAGPATPSPSSSAQIVAARQDLLLEPVLDGVSSVPLSIAGVGDATVSLPSVGTRPGTGAAGVTIAYGFDCGDPRFDGDPNGPDNDVSEYRLTDNLGAVLEGSCAPVGAGVAVAGFGVGRDLDPRGRATLRVDVPSQDTVWRLAVAVTGM